MNYRTLTLKDAPVKAGPVIYWMSRDQRVSDNWALVMAQKEAIKMQQPLLVVFCLVSRFLEATDRHFGFLLKGLLEVSEKLKEYGIPFLMVEGEPESSLPKVVQEFSAGMLFTDFNPLRISREWKEGVAKNIHIPFIEVDAHNIVPCFHASPKQEFGAYTIRPKIHRMLDSFLLEIPEIERHPFRLEAQEGVGKSKSNGVLEEIQPYLALTNDIFRENRFGFSKSTQSGEVIAKRVLEDFIAQGLPHYHLRNDPGKDACSGLSPYLHFGQISAQRVALEVRKAGGVNSPEFLEELIVRRELSDNFCYYNKNYDSFEGFPNWAKETLTQHRGDHRAHLYTLDELEQGRTHDRLWNAAQFEMVKTGKMHGYMRMYWAKKILEWTGSPEEAMSHAIYMNDKYSMDGRDPNGYTGIAWSIGGVHDRAWGERPVFGKIRYMAYDGCKRKFDIEAYIKRMWSL